MNNSGKKCIAILITAALAMSAAPCASAEMAEETASKGSCAAAGTALDKSAYSDAAAYTNETARLETVRVGLSYGEGAVDRAAFTDASGTGFELGVCTEGEFESLWFCPLPGILVQRASAVIYNWHILMDGEYDTQAAAQAAADNVGGFTGYIDGRFRVLLWSVGSSEYAHGLINKYGFSAVPYRGSESAYLVFPQNSDRPVFLLDSGANLALRPNQAVTSPLCSYDDNVYKGSFQCVPAEDQRMSVVNSVDIESYVKGVIPYELSSDWPEEALKTLAVCARTYAEIHAGEYEEQGFDLTDDVYSQVYNGVNAATERTDNAVDVTAGQYVRYEGKICEVFYFSSDGGATESGQLVFGVEARYLSGITDPFDGMTEHYLREWTVERDGYELQWLLSNRGYIMGQITEIIPEYSSNGNVSAMTYKDYSGATLRLEGREAYNAIGLNSCRFSVERGEDGFVFSGGGWGHNCGLSQWGAYSMAELYGYSYDDIIRFYYCGAYVG